MTTYVTRTAGRTRWGVFTNFWPTATSRRDRIAGRYFHVHTPWRVLEVYL